MNLFLDTVQDLEHYDVVRSWILRHKFQARGPRQWTQHAVMTVEEASKSDVVEVIEEASVLK